LEADHHIALVDAWLQRASIDVSSPLLLRRFEVAFAALWVRARTTLGDVTLTAIADRVLYNAAEQFPVFARLSIDADTGIHSKEIRVGLGAQSKSELERAIRFVLIEFLTVIGNLTAEILTQDLHAALASIAYEGEDQSR